MDSFNAMENTMNKSFISEKKFTVKHPYEHDKISLPKLEDLVGRNTSQSHTPIIPNNKYSSRNILNKTLDDTNQGLKSLNNPRLKSFASLNKDYSQDYQNPILKNIPFRNFDSNMQADYET
mmetsp:Transcript_7846/g.7329  ORF Transcript_7846/g.7329 Transcript_7846/m.7329 type:complete len:121 (-) Transcript_7846:2893-3255(-)|eukprot:CAMPEP_0170552502 /NCGR_PEP_ID=MMETSP0211-20121228/10372_1 /TAXON_ID=311385 /ORGANISM="Pseudokeronopsis sp., Strain OXSARD2" /LENGTH=120 /DNA_ID=CAMNT_0010860245 /DNA_START=1376 /DNA_END=1738 /DNA_ORIENTATION=+